MSSPNARRRCAVSIHLAIALSLTLASSNAFAHKGHKHKTGPAKKMVAAATTFVETLGPELRAKASFEFDSEERQAWHFIPKDRPGVALKEMSLEQRKAAHALLQSLLSSKGYLKVTSVMSLEQVLREIEKSNPNRKHDRDQERYWFSIFGDPSLTEPWGWRVEGHHLSLNITCVEGALVVAMPSFVGANPAEIRSGPRAGLRVLGTEEDLARDIMGSLNDEQSKLAIIETEAPADVITGPGKPIDLGQPVGLPMSKMTPRQKATLWRLIQEYASSYRGPFVKKELRKIKSADEAIHFAWAGSLKRGEGHYYRIHGPTFIIEYDNTQNDANHIHTVWHSLDNEFGLDALRKHYEATPHEE